MLSALGLMVLLQVLLWIRSRTMANRRLRALMVLLRVLLWLRLRTLMVLLLWLRLRTLANHRLRALIDRSRLYRVGSWQLVFVARLRIFLLLLLSRFLRLLFLYFLPLRHRVLSRCCGTDGESRYPPLLVLAFWHERRHAAGCYPQEAGLAGFDAEGVS